MRVIAGSARRLQLIAPKGMTTRPTSDKVKETLFNILMPDIYEASFLDLFSGSGGIGIEALSRGAKSATFVEKSKEAISCIKTNLDTTHFKDCSTIMATDAVSALRMLEGKSHFDLVFMDPPYDMGFEEEILSVLAHSSIIDDDSMIICESSVETDYSFVEDLGFEVLKVKEYKNNKHVFLRKE